MERKRERDREREMIFRLNGSTRDRLSRGYLSLFGCGVERENNGPSTAKKNRLFINQLRREYVLKNETRG